MKALVFDMDGTILNTIDDIAASVNYSLEKYSFPLRSVEEIKSFVGNGLKRTLELSVPDGTPAECVDDMFSDFVEYYKEHANVYTKPYDGIVEAIDSLKREGFRLAVVSNKRVEAVVELCHVFYEGLFEQMIGDCEGIRRKPEPDMVLKALDNMGVAPEDAVYIGDSEVDILTAKNSGLGGIFVSWGYRGREFLEAAGAETIVDTPDELVRVLLGKRK